MNKFGKNPPRSLSSFGVSGLLGPECHVFYDTLFSSKNLGKVIDLLAARLEKAGADELKLRMLILLSVFEAMRASQQSGSSPFKDPLRLECGLDDEKFAVGVLIKTTADFVSLEGLKERVTSNNPLENPFDWILRQLLEFSDRLVVKHQPTQNQIEIVSLLALPGKIESAPVTLLERMDVLTLGQELGTSAPSQSYVELGDLDYKALLKEDSPKFKKDEEEASPMGKILSEAVLPGGTAVTVGHLEEDDSLAKAIRGRTRGVSEDAQVVSGETGKPDDSVTRITGDSTDLTSNEVRKVESTGSETDFSKKEQHYQMQIRELQRKLTRLQGAQASQPIRVAGGGSAEAISTRWVSQTLEAETQIEEKDLTLKSLVPEAAVGEAPASSPQPEAEALSPEPVPTKKLKQAAEPTEETKVEEELAEDEEYVEEGEEGEEEEEEEEEETSGGGWFSKFVKKVKGGSPKEKAPSKEEPASSAPDEEEDLPEVSEPSASGTKLPETSTQLAGNEKDPKIHAQNLLFQVEGGSFDQALRKFQVEGDRLKSQLPNAKQKKWLEAMIHELNQEKAKIQGFAKKLNLSMKQRELEHKNREHVLEEELKRREETIKEKEKLIVRAKDQVTQVSMNLERMKGASKNAAVEGQFQKRFNYTKGLLTNALEENATLKKKMDEMKAEALSLRRAEGSEKNDFQKLRDDLERTQKWNETLKTQNADLADKVQSSDVAVAVSNQRLEELRTRLGRAIKIATVEKDRTHALQLELDALRGSKAGGGSETPESTSPSLGGAPDKPTSKKPKIPPSSAA